MLFDFCSSQKQILMIQQFLQQFITHLSLVLILMRNIPHYKISFLTACLHIFLVLSWSGMNFNNSGFFYYFSNTNFWRLIVVCAISTINHFIYTKAKKKNLSWLDWKLKQNFHSLTRKLFSFVAKLTKYSYILTKNFSE